MEEKNKGGRPSKLPTFLEAMEKVLNDEINAIILTDEELFLLANEQLEEKDRIGYATFKEYKSSKEQKNKEALAAFSALYKKAITIQKKSLFTKLKGDEGQWQKYAWIIERKFKDWNLRQISESKVENTNINLNKDISKLSDEELKELLKDSN